MIMVAVTFITRTKADYSKLVRHEDKCLFISEIDDDERNAEVGILKMSNQTQRLSK